MPCSEPGSSFSKTDEYERAIEAYDNLLETYPDSIWPNEVIYQQAVCYRSIGKLEAASERFKLYRSIIKDRGIIKEILPEN